jgi:hypothetical protein
MSRQMLFTGLSFLAILGFSAGTAQAAPPDACVTPHNSSRNAHFRTLHQSGSSMIWLSSHDDRVDICISLADCYWKLVDIPIADLGQFSDLAGDTGRCSNSTNDLFHLGAVIHSRCETPKELGDRLSVLNRWLAGVVVGASCGSSASPLTDAGFLFADGRGDPVLVLQAPAKPLCLAMALPLGSPSGPIALLIPACMQRREDLGPFYARIAPEIARRPTDTAWIGAETSTSGFALATNSDGTSPNDKVAPLVWGAPLNEAYVAAWLMKVGVAAKGYDELAKKDDPLRGASPTDFAGRLAKWLTAGLLRISTKPFSADWLKTRAARNWMASNATSGVSAFDGTLLRGEIARMDWR